MLIKISREGGLDTAVLIDPVERTSRVMVSMPADGHWANLEGLWAVANTPGPEAWEARAREALRLPSEQPGY